MKLITRIKCRLHAIRWAAGEVLAATIIALFNH